VRLFFDEHNHPVSKERAEKMTPAERGRCQWRRCYKVVFLLHCDHAGERFVVAGLKVLRGNQKVLRGNQKVLRGNQKVLRGNQKVLRGNQAEGPALWELVDTFVETAGPGVVKTLMVDRGFIEGPQIGRLKTDYGVDTELTLSLEGKARRRALAQARRLRQEAPPS